MFVCTIPYLVMIALRWGEYFVFDADSSSTQVKDKFMTYYEDLQMLNYSVDMFFSIVVAVATPVMMAGFLRKMKQKHKMIYETHKKRYII